MKLSEFRKLIREEVRKVVSEVKTTGKYYYIYFNGKNAVQGDPMKSKKDIVNLGMEASDVKSVGPVYAVKLGTYTIYVITSNINKKDIWCVATPGDKAFADDNVFSYKLCMKAIEASKSGKGKQMTFEEYLK